MKLTKNNKPNQDIPVLNPASIDLTKKMDCIPVYVKMYISKDFDALQKQLGNRHISEKDIADMRARIQVKNRLMQNPIIINKGLEVIDGQTRSSAAETLNENVLIMCDDEANIHDTQDMNQNRKNWSQQQWLQSFCDLENMQYICLKKFAKKYSLSINSAIMLTMKKIPKNLKYFKDGEYTYDNEEHATLVVKRCHDLKDIFKWWNNAKFIKAMSYIAKYVKDYDHAHMVSRAYDYQARLCNAGSEADFRRMLDNIYNAGLKKGAAAKSKRVNFNCD